MTLIRAISRTRPAVTVDDDCTEPLVYGSNLLKDPGFELHLTNTDAASWSNSIPADSTRASNNTPESGLIWPDTADGNLDTWTPAGSASGWMMPNISGSIPDNVAFWVVSTANPRSGTYHARYTVPVGYPTSAPNFGPYTQGRCVFPFNPYSARVAEGDTVLFSCHLMVSDDGSGPESFLRFNYFDETYLGAGTATGGSFGTPTSYTLVTSEETIPAGVHYVTINVHNTFLDDGVSVDIDDCVLSVTAA